MVRIIIKGVWKNTEDEVLKAAIAKYGKNQWARISSLLVRKTPKQCKARWYEWLDPSIKKTEWSKTEDEKLVHLAKLMATQWRTIAPIVGRTATQCLERYQKLLDEAEAKENEELGLAGPGGEAGPSAEDVRKLRPGEIDPDPETKPARPDPIDMDEDEKEMLSEARARLANTQGKKAKRKARERQLEEARRLAVLQKKRELKAAGIIMRHKIKKKGMDYNADIPFEKKPAPGFYDTSEEQARVTAAPIGQSLKRLENKRKNNEEYDDAERKKRQRANAEGKSNEPHQTKFVPARDAQIKKLKEAEQMGNRRKLMLPPAQVGEAELDEIVKIGLVGQQAKLLVDRGGDEPSGQLLGEYSDLEKAKMARTPRTAPEFDNVMAEARNLRNMIQAQTPLLGEENTPLHQGPNGGTGFEGATPRERIAFTPNPLATPLRGLPSADGVVGGVAATPLRTPMRDNLRLNPDEGFASAGETPREQRIRAQDSKRTLRAGFISLPKPANDYEILAPEDEEGINEAKTMDVEDAAERDLRLKRIREEEERKALNRRSTVVKLGLPRPANIDVDRLVQDLSLSIPSDEFTDVKKLIDIEFVQLMQHDSIAHPIPGTARPGATRSDYEHPDDSDVSSVKEQIRRELASFLGYPDANEEAIKQGILALSQNEEDIHETLSWAHERERLLYNAETRSWVEPTTLSSDARMAGYSALLEQDREAMAREASRAAKIEKKLNVVLGGFQMRNVTLGNRIVSAFSELQRNQVDFECFQRLFSNETATAPRRVAALKEEVERLETRERGLQFRYKELEEELREIQINVANAEERIMLEAEALNEAALEEIPVAA